MGGLLKIITKLFGKNALSKTIGTRTNVIKLPSNDVKKFIKRELDIEKASDAAVEKAYKDMQELIPDLPKMNDQEKLIFKGNLQRLDNRLNPPSAEVLEFGTKQPVGEAGIKELGKKLGLPEGIDPKSSMGQGILGLKRRGAELEQATPKISDVLDDAMQSQMGLRKLEDEGLVRATVRQILDRDRKSGRVKLNKAEDQIITFQNQGDPIDIFRKYYGEDALEQVDSLVPQFREMRTQQEAADLVESKFKLEPRSDRPPGSFDPDNPPEFAEGGRVNMAIGGDPFTQSEQQQRATQSYQDYLARVGYQGRQQPATYTAPSGVDTSAYQGFSVPADYMSTMPAAVTPSVPTPVQDLVSPQTPAPQQQAALPSAPSAPSGGGGGSSVFDQYFGTTQTPPALEAVQPSVSGGIMGQFQNAPAEAFTATIEDTIPSLDPSTGQEFYNITYRSPETGNILGQERFTGSLSDLEDYKVQGETPSGDFYTSYQIPSYDLAGRDAAGFSLEGMIDPFDPYRTPTGYGEDTFDVVSEPDLEPGYEAVPASEFGLYNLPGTITLTPQGPVYTESGLGVPEGGELAIEPMKQMSTTDKLLEGAKKAGKDYAIATALNFVFPGLGGLYTSGKIASKMIPEPIKQKAMEQLYKLDPESAPGYKTTFFSEGFDS